MNPAMGKGFLGDGGGLQVGVNALKRLLGRWCSFSSAEPKQPLVLLSCASCLGTATKPSPGTTDVGWGSASSTGAALCDCWGSPHGSASPSSDIQDRSIIKIYRKEPLYASFPASHITNGDLRVRGWGPGGWAAPRCGAGVGARQEGDEEGMAIACVCGRSRGCHLSSLVVALLKEWMFGAWQQGVINAIIRGFITMNHPALEGEGGSCHLPKPGGDT